MSYSVIKPLPTVEEFHKKFPLSEELAQQVKNDVQDIKNILSGKDSRKILIIGPCSAWPENAVIEYAKAMMPIKEKYKDTIKFVMRVYIQKPRTTVGWVGPVNQPDPFSEPDLVKGFEYCRKMMLEIISLGYAIADEAVYTHKKGYFTDLYSWIAIGARSAEDQEHRLFASLLDVPVGMKNPTSGDIATGVNSVIAAQFSHTFAIEGNQIKTDGNEYAHLILRGGASGNHLDKDSLLFAANTLVNKKVANPSMIVDISHDNSVSPETGKKDPLLQPSLLLKTLDHVTSDPLLSSTVKGFMIESFILDGAQNVNACVSMDDVEQGKSITDGCVGLEKSIEMINNFASALQK